MIAADLVRLAKNQPDPQVRIDCLGPALEFERLVELRNGILHGEPGTASTGEQRLMRHGNPLTPTMIDDAADEFAACSIFLNALLYDQLKWAKGCSFCNPCNEEGPASPLGRTGKPMMGRLGQDTLF
jgi:hypothetical protein